MPDTYRRSIEELITRYELEPELRDVYVEGDRDKFFLSWFFEMSTVPKPVIYPVNVAVNISNHTLLRAGVAGNRGRVIVLCAELEGNLPQIAENVVGVVDLDYSELLGTIPSSPQLLCTDFSCMESYSITDGSLNKFFQVYLGTAFQKDRCHEMFDILVELFLLRAAKISLSKSAWPERFTQACSIIAGHVVFDRNGFVYRVLNAGAGTLTLSALEAKVVELRSKSSSDFRRNLNGHDLIQIFSWFAHQIGVDAAIYNERPLQRALMTSVDYDELCLTSLFKALLQWSTAGAANANSAVAS
jgi:hypothetical protein